MAEFLLAEVILTIPGGNPPRRESIPPGTLAYVTRDEDGNWLAYFRGGSAVRLSAEKTALHLRSIRDSGGWVVPDITGTGTTLAHIWCRRSGGPPVEGP